MQDPVVIVLLFAAVYLTPSWSEVLTWVAIGCVFLISIGGFLSQVIAATVIIAIDAERHGRPVSPQQK